MCGISGIVFKNGAERGLLYEQIHQMNELQKHRGPDNEGITIFNHENKVIENNSAPAQLALGHRRLSIIDLTPEGNQPMTEESDRYVITYNGEIYNYLELRKELEEKGIGFKTNSDTEVLLKGYIHWGNSLYKKLEGMWAFAIFDKTKSTLTLSRDRTGVKPLFYTNNTNEFRFASEIKALIPFIQFDINLTSYNRFVLNNEVQFESDTFFNDVYELQPGYELTLDLTNFKCSKRRYFDPRELLIDTSSTKTVDEHSEELYSILIEAVNFHYRSDVTVGANLSGGLDSSTIVGLMRSINPKISIPVFSAIFPGQPYNEEELIRASVKKHKLDWKTCIPDGKGLIQIFEDLAFTHEYPLISTSSYAQYCVMQEAKNQGVKVLINGQGADELLGGYLKYGVFQQLQTLKNLDISGFKQGPANLKFLLKEFGKSSIASSASLSELMQSKFNSDYKYIHQGQSKKNQTRNKTPKNLNEFLLQDYYQGFLTGLLRAEDRNSMRFSIESRVPFANSHKLAKWAFQLPSTLKYNQSENKPLLRNMLKNNNLIPKKVLHKKEKLGFSTPMNQWLIEFQNELLEYIDEIPSDLASKNVLQDDLKKRMFDSRNSNDEQPCTFKWFSLGAWFKAFKK